MIRREVILKVKEYIRENLNDEIKLDEIAKAIGYSKFHLNRLFKDETGTTIHQYILRCRMERSAQLLRDTDQTVLEIALNSGYTTQQSYTVAFRQIYEVTPQGYRIRHILNKEQVIKLQSRLNQTKARLVA